MSLDLLHVKPGTIMLGCVGWLCQNIYQEIQTVESCKQSNTFAQVIYGVCRYVMT